MKNRFLADLTRAQFMRRHWQKKPLFAAGALRDYAHAITREQLFRLATRDDVESRIVRRVRGRWDVQHGPFTGAHLRAMPRSGWTLLVQGVDQMSRQAARLLREFDFLPYARLDDVMVSYAAPGGGVGPHVDSYDVFLVQCAGERRWQVSAQRNLELVANAPFRVLERFEAEREWIARPGDVVYLPPQYAHDGVAVDECITCSVGFRAPAAQELTSRFLDFAQDRLELHGIYADPGLRPTRSPGRIPPSMLDYARRTLEGVRWSASDVAEFLGRYMSEPKEHVIFQRPRRPLGAARFAQRVGRAGVRLRPTTRMLFHGRRLFINGEVAAVGPAAARALRRLADARELAPPLALEDEALQLLHAWYAAGYVEIRV